MKPRRLGRDEPLKDTYGREFSLPNFTMKDILDAIPAECYERSAARGFGYVSRDLLLIVLMAYYAIPWLPNDLVG
jgi:hypothetical protein